MTEAVCNRSVNCVIIYTLYLTPIEVNIMKKRYQLRKDDRIKALRSFGVVRDKRGNVMRDESGNIIPKVRKGEVGGKVKVYSGNREAFLSHYGDCWIDSHTTIRLSPGDLPPAVMDNAHVQSKVLSNAVVYGEGRIASESTSFRFFLALQPDGSIARASPRKA